MKLKAQLPRHLPGPVEDNSTYRALNSHHQSPVSTVVLPSALLFTIMHHPAKEESNGFRGSLLHLVIDLQTLHKAAVDQTLMCCGSLLLNAHAALDDGAACVEGPKTIEERSVPQHQYLLPMEIPRRLPEALKVAAVRYKLSLQLPFRRYQQLLDLFLDYILQCRCAYEQLSPSAPAVASDVSVDASAGPASNTIPSFCDLGGFKVGETPEGAVIVHFRSLVALHDGKDVLNIQWADEVGVSLAVKQEALVFRRCRSNKVTVLLFGIACVCAG